MLKKNFIIKEENGLHARPASALVKIAGQFKCNITIVEKEKKVNAKSIMAVLAIGVKQNSEITIITEGEDEIAALNRIAELIEAEFEI